MTLTNKDIALVIINFLKSSVKSNVISEEYAESMDVAIDCVADAFEVDKDDDEALISSKFKGKSLYDMLSKSVQEGSSKTASTRDVSEEVKAQADDLKVQGNRLMSAKDYAGAIAKYTEAIEIDGSNEVYYSNRAAAYLSSSDFNSAVADAEKAIEINPNFVKAYSRLGLAKYSLGDASAAMKAYEKGLSIEGDNKSDAMIKGYETAKRRVEENLESSIPGSEVSTEKEESSSNASANTGGMPDLGSMFGGAGGMPSFSDMLSNPQVMQAAQNLMSNPSAMSDLMNNPALRQMAENFGGQGGSGPNFSELMNNPMVQNMAKQFMGGNKGPDQNNS